MDRYLFTARSVTHAQQMASALERGGIHCRVRRISGSGAMKGCGYTIEIAAQRYEDALRLLRGTAYRPVKVFRVSGGETSEVMP